MTCRSRSATSSPALCRSPPSGLWRTLRGVVRTSRQRVDRRSVPLGSFRCGGSRGLTQSVPAAMIAAVLAGLAMAALLAVFSINYLVNQVVLGVVLNLLAIGLTGFLFDQLVSQRRSSTTPRRCSSPFRFRAFPRSRSSAACSSNRTSWPIWRQSRSLWSGWCSTDHLGPAHPSHRRAS